MRGNNNKEKLYTSVFKVLLSSRQYNNVKIENIEEVSGLTRGAIVYYNRNKNDLVRDVIDEYIFKRQSIKIKLKDVEADSLLDFIYAYITRINETINTLKTILEGMNVENPFKGYMAIGLTADYYYPKFAAKLRETFDEEITLWVDHIKKAQEKGEIRADLNPSHLAEQFRYIFLGQAYTQSLTEGLDPEHLKDLLLEFYNLIKL